MAHRSHLSTQGLVKLGIQLGFWRCRIQVRTVWSRLCTFASRYNFGSTAPTVPRSWKVFEKPAQRLRTSSIIFHISMKVSNSRMLPPFFVVTMRLYPVPPPLEKKPSIDLQRRKLAMYLGFRVRDIKKTYANTLTFVAYSCSNPAPTHSHNN